MVHRITYQCARFHHCHHMPQHTYLLRHTLFDREITISPFKIRVILHKISRWSIWKICYNSEPKSLLVVTKKNYRKQQQKSNTKIINQHESDTIFIHKCLSVLSPKNYAKTNRQIFHKFYYFHSIQSQWRNLVFLHKMSTVEIYNLTTTDGYCLLSVLWHCWLGVGKSIRTVIIKW